MTPGRNPKKQNQHTTQTLGFISDVHGNLPALQAVLSELERRGVDRIHAAGDHLTGGQQPLEVWRTLESRRVVLCQGTGDLALATVRAMELTAQTDLEAQRLEAFRQTQASLGDLIIERVRRLPQQVRVPLIDGRELTMVHGSPRDMTEAMSHDDSDDDLLAAIADDPADLVVCGGTHVPFQREVSEVHVINVGSVGQAPGDESIAHYTVIQPALSGTTIEQNWVRY